MFYLLSTYLHTLLSMFVVRRIIKYNVFYYFNRHLPYFLEFSLWSSHIPRSEEVLFIKLYRVREYFTWFLMNSVRQNSFFIYFCSVWVSWGSFRCPAPFFFESWQQVTEKHEPGQICTHLMRCRSNKMENIKKKTESLNDWRTGLFLKRH